MIDVRIAFIKKIIGAVQISLEKVYVTPVTVVFVLPDEPVK